MTSFNNSKKSSFLLTLNVTSIQDDNNDLSSRCKFNFSYFTVQPAGQDFSDWSHDDLVKLFEKLKHYGKEPLSHWRTLRQKNHTVLAVYGQFPKKSDFVVPPHIPHQAEWSRFRLESGVRLIGFVLPSEFQDNLHSKTAKRFDCNTFYVVFLDQHHLFYKMTTEKR